MTKSIINRKGFIIAGSLIVVVVAIVLGGAMQGDDSHTRTAGAAIYNDPYVCAMHPHKASEGPGTCEICAMDLSKLEGHTPGAPMPPISQIYASPDNPLYVHEGQGKDPKTGSALIPITQSPFYEAPKVQGHGQSGDADQHESHKGGDGLYTCGMHPDVIQAGPGTCPICGMALTPLKGSSSKKPGGERTIAYWVAPMDPNYISDKPGKSPMGMDLVPVYEDELREGVVAIDPVTIQNIGVVTTLIERRDLTSTIRSNGIVTIAEDGEYRVNPKISGWVEKLYVSRTGDMVRRGDPLLEIYSPELVSAQEEYLLARTNSQMLAGSGIDRIRSGADDLLGSARKRLELWDIDEDQIAGLERTGKVSRTMTLFSPVDGVVLHKNVVEGAAVKAGMDIYRLADLSQVWVEAQIYEYELPWLKTGARATINSPYDPELNLSGRVDYIYPYLDAKTRTVKVRIVLANSGLDLLPEMFVDVRIEGKTRKDAVALPKNAVIRSGERDLVFVEVGRGRFLPREVKLGLETGDFYEVIEGVSPGTSVVTSAQFLLDSEAKLQEAVQRRLQARMKAGASQ